MKPQIKNLFEHKNYPTIMYLSITIILILIFFSFVGVLESSQKIKTSSEEIKKISLTGYTADNTLIDYDSDNKEYPKNAFNYYYLLLALTYKLIIITSIVLMYKIKKIFKPKNLNDI